MNEILKEYLHDFVVVYIDNVIVFSLNKETHLVHLEKVFQKIREAKIKLRGDECEIRATTLNILGHTMSHKEIKP